ncbi:hypothetical protein Tco_0534912 [Tanacetum coccineum]
MASKEASSKASIPIPSPGPNGYDPEHVGISFRLGGKSRLFSLLEFGRRVGLYSEDQALENGTRIGLRNAVTVKAEHLLMEFWPTIRDGVFIVGARVSIREDDEVEEAPEEGAGGSSDAYRDMSRRDWQARQGLWMDQMDGRWGQLETWMTRQDEHTNWVYNHIVCQF